MATPNYHLHQWERGDRPTRSDFNEDFRTIDTALHDTHQQAERSLEGVEQVGYHAASLMLQRGKAGDSVQYQNGLFVEPFYNQNNISSLTGFTFDSQDKRLSLVNQGPTSYSLNYGTGASSTLNAGQQLNFPWDCTFTGEVISVTYYVTGSSSSSAFTIQLNNLTTQTQVGSVVNGRANGEVTVNLSASVVKGQRYSFLFTNNSGTQLLCYSADKTTLMGLSYSIQPTRASNGTMLSRAITVPTYTGVRAWVRHSSGTVTLSLLSGGVWTPMELESQRSAYTVQGASCQERIFVLNGLPSGRSAQLRLEATASVGAINLIHEYALLTV